MSPFLPWVLSVAIVALFIILGFLLKKFIPNLFKKKIDSGSPSLYQVFSDTLILWMASLGLLMARFYIPASSIHQFDKILISLVIFTIGLTIADIFILIVREKIGKGPMNLPATTLTINLVRYAVLTIAVLMIFSVLGIAVAPLLTALGVGSLAVALGLHDTLSNFFAGIYILKSQIIKIGDYIRLESGQEGFVIDVGLRVVHLKTLSNTMIYVPTSKISQSVITNFSHPTEDFTTSLDIQVGFDSDVEKVEKITLETAEEVMKKLNITGEEPLAIVRFHGFGDAGIQLTVFLRAEEMTTRLLLVHEFLKALTRRYAEQKIQLAIPQRIIHQSK